MAGHLTQCSVTQEHNPNEPVREPVIISSKTIPTPLQYGQEESPVFMFFRIPSSIIYRFRLLLFLEEEPPELVEEVFVSILRLLLI